MIKSTLVLAACLIAAFPAHSQNSPSIFIPATTVICDCDSMNANCYTAEWPAYCITSAMEGYPDSLVTDDFIFVKVPVPGPDTLNYIPIYRHRFVMNLPDADSGLINLREGGTLSYHREGRNLKPKWVEKGKIQTFELVIYDSLNTGYSIDVHKGEFRYVLSEKRH